MPWMDKRVFTQVLDYLKDYGKYLDYVIQIGDLYDLFSSSKFPRTQNLITPAEEFKEARMMAEEFWRVIQKRAPNARCHQLLGNHDERPIKRLIEKAPELEHFFNMKAPWEFEGVKTQNGEREELILEGICFMHGYRSKLGDHAKYNLMNTVCGHSHTGGVHYFPLKEKTLFELNVGYLGDPEALPMRYTRQKIVTKWTPGFGVIDELGPRFVPL